jgi:hypothetical protein
MPHSSLVVKPLFSRYTTKSKRASGFRSIHFRQKDESRECIIIPKYVCLGSHQQVQVIQRAIGSVLAHVFPGAEKLAPRDGAAHCFQGALGLGVSWPAHKLACPWTHIVCRRCLTVVEPPSLTIGSSSSSRLTLFLHSTVRFSISPLRTWEGISCSPSSGIERRQVGHRLALTKDMLRHPRQNV